MAGAKIPAHSRSGQVSVVTGDGGRSRRCPMRARPAPTHLSRSWWC